MLKLKPKENKPISRSRHGKVRILPKEVVKAEWQDLLNHCSKLIIATVLINPEFCKDKGKGALKIWIDANPFSIAGPKRIRVDFHGDVDGIYKERIADIVTSWLGSCRLYDPIPSYVRKAHVTIPRSHSVIVLETK